tara:strand:+ start:7805 stop:9154 length:1350 start_codon:yes stop_codon:yes gene_type:complete
MSSQLKASKIFALRKADVKNKIIEFLLFVVYKLLFGLFLLPYHLVYNIETAPAISKVVLGWIIYIAILFIAINKLKDYYYSAVYKFLFILGGVSTLLIFEMERIDNLDFIKAMSYWVVLLFVFIYSQKTAIRQSSRIQLPKIPDLQYFLLIFAVFFTVAMSGIYSGFRLTLSFDEIYTYRLEMRAEQMPAIVNYLLYFLGGAILPYCFAFFISRKLLFTAGIALFSGILIFSINGMKTWLVIYLLVLFVFISFRFDKNKLISYLLIGMIMWIVLSLFLFYRSSSVNLMALLGRTTYIPSRIGYDYIAFFDDNVFLFLRESILKFFFDAPYPHHSAFYIVDGNATDVLTTSRANNGLWGDAYANFAFFGILVYPVLFTAIIASFRRSMKGEDIRLLISVSFILLWSAINTSFFTWLVSGGVIVLLIINKASRPLIKTNKVQININKKSIS